MNSINWPASLCMGLHSSARTALQHKCRGHGIKSRWSPEKPFFGLFHSWRRRSITICILCQILVCFFFFIQMSWIFACAPRFNRKSQPCIFLRWFLLFFPVKMYAKKVGGAFCSLLLNDKQKKPFVFPKNETSEASRSHLFFAYVFTQKWSANQQKKNTRLWLSTKSETICSSAHLDEKKKTDHNST